MIYKLTDVEKVESRETFDRSSVIGNKFEFVSQPMVGDRLCARDLSDNRYLTTTVVIGVIKAANTVVVKTKHMI